MSNDPRDLSIMTLSGITVLSLCTTIAAATKSAPITLPHRPELVCSIDLTKRVQPPITGTTMIKIYRAADNHNDT